MRKLTVFSLLVLFLALCAGVITAYLIKFERQLAEEHHARMAEVSGLATAHMGTMVNDMLTLLQSTSLILQNTDDKDRLAGLEAVVDRSPLVYAGYAGPDGRLSATAFTESVNINEESYFRLATRGEATISNLVRKILPNKVVSGVILAVPFETPEGTGALVGMLETRLLKGALSLKTFGGEGDFYVIDREGTVIMRTRALEFANLFQAWRTVRFEGGNTLASMMFDVAAGRDGMTSLRNLVGQSRYVYYRPLPFNNWTLVTVVDAQAVTAKTVRLTRELAVIGGGMAIVFMLLLYFCFHVTRRSQESRLAAEAKSAFLANMSHEIRTPMNAIVGLSEIMLRDPLPPTQREQITRILSSGKGLLTIINDILDVSKIEAGKFTIEEEPYLLESLLYDITLVAAIRIGEKPISFTVEPAKNLPGSLRGDIGRVRQVLLNLVNNAIKFTECGSITLKVDAEPADQDWLLHFTVSDTGMGIKKEDLEQLFVRFNQVDTRRTRQIEGTGLGLTISDKLCEMMGGGISVTSTYGVGSNFIITIRQGKVDDALALVCAPIGHPRLVVCETAADVRIHLVKSLDQLGLDYTLCDSVANFAWHLKQGGYTHMLGRRESLGAIVCKADEPTRIVLLSLQEHYTISLDGSNVFLPLLALHLPYVLNGTAKELHGCRLSLTQTTSIDPLPHVAVLIVDDNELNIMVAEGLMEPFGMRMDSACSGKEAISAMQKYDYDLVLMDHMMPEMDGIEAALRIRELGGHAADVPIVALTANATSEARELFMTHGFADFLTKPIEPHKLFAVLNTLLKDVNASRE